MEYPKIYDPKQYVNWHNRKIPADKDLSEKIEILRNDLQKKAVKDLKFLNDLFRYFSNYCKIEYKKQKGSNTKYELPLNKILKNKASKEYLRLFKEGSSIINKLWRKNKDSKNLVSITNIQSCITDLIRTEIIGETLDACRFFANSLNEDNIYEVALKRKFKKIIRTIEIEPEMKMASGYFAYHILFYFMDGLIIEVQIYSSVSKKWRDLSHRLYETIRLAPIERFEFGATESRLISLGHLFHLAECEIEKIQAELNKIAPKV